MSNNTFTPRGLGSEGRFSAEKEIDVARKIGQRKKQKKEILHVV